MTINELKALEDERKKNVQQRMRLGDSNKKNKLKEEAEKEYEVLKVKYEVIPTTIENIRIILAYLNTINWGLWRLPSMSIGYKCNQHDCEGKTATTMVLDEPISDEEYGIENETMFVFGNPHGFLNKYQKIR